MGDTRIECFELLCDFIKIQNTLAPGNLPSSRTQWRTSYESGVFKHFLLKFPTVTLSHHCARMAYATLCAKNIRTASRKFIARRATDRMGAQHVKRRFPCAFHFTHFTYSITGHAQRLELLSTLDFLPCLDTSALLLP